MNIGPWLVAIRPRTLVASLAPIAVGLSVAASFGEIQLGPALLTLFAALAIQIATNLVNDVADFERGADGPDRLGPKRAAASGLIEPRVMRLAATLTFGLAILFGAALSAISHPAVIAVGLISMLAGWAYTAGPWPLAYLGLGELFVLVFFGPVAVAGTCFVQIGWIPAVTWWASIPVGALAAAILVINNLRDRQSDERVNKRTLAVRFGRRFVLGEYFLLLAAAELVPIAIFATGLAAPAMLLPLLTLPEAGRLAHAAATREGRDLNQVLAHTARLLGVFGLLFAAALGLTSGKSVGS